MQGYNFDKICDDGVRLGLQRLEESSEFSSMFCEFCQAYGKSLSTLTGKTIVVREGVDPLDSLRSRVKNGCSFVQFRFPNAPLEGPEREEVTASLLNAEKNKIATVKVFDCVKDRLTVVPCAIEYNGKSVLCNTKEDLQEALSKIPAERSSYVIKGLGLGQHTH